MKPSVLIVDDSLTVRMDLQEAFESIGFSTKTSDTLAAAREALAERPFSLVILDVLLPDGDGVDLLREIKNTSTLATTPVVLLSTEAEVRDRVRGLKTGADEYVGKPYDRANVLSRARQLAEIEKPSSASALKLLLIDDSLTFRNEFKAVLENAGYSVITAETGEEGLRTAVAVRPDAVIVNGVLPGGLDGAAVIRRLKDDITLRNTPCLLLTATESTGDELRTFEAGADAYVRKGVDIELILARIVALLRSLGPHIAEPEVAGLLGPKKILTVDDSPTYLHELSEELHKEGYDVIPARSGKEALELLEVEQVDCILLDLLMPELSGQETCRIIKKTSAWRNVPLLILTAVEETKAMVEGINAGADDYIPKSSDFEVLKARLRAQLRRKQFEDEYRAIRERLSQKEIEAARAKAAQEIAEARASFEPLLRNEAWLNNVVRIAHLGAWDWDLAKNTQSWSDEQFRILGLEPGTVAPCYDRFLQALHAVDRERFAEAVKQSLAKEPRFQIDCRIVRPNRELRHAVCQGEICRNEADQPVRIIGTMLDITERQQAEEQLRKASLYTRGLIEASLDPLVTINRDGKITDVNSATELATGLARENLIGSDFSNYFTDPDQAQQGYKAVFADGMVRDYPLALRHASGKTMDVLYNATLFKNSAGEVEGVFAAARDVTERKRAERALRSLSACNESLMRATDEASLLKRICDLVVNVGGYRMAWVGFAEHDEERTVRVVAESGFEAGYLDTVNVTWADEERGRGPAGTAIRTGEVAACQDTRSDPCFALWRENAMRRGYRSCLALPLKNGEEVLGALSIFAAELGTFDEDERHLLEELSNNLSYGIVALRARAQGKRAEEEVRRLNSELEQRVLQRTAQLEAANKELEAFSYSVSHDLRAPLRAINGFAQILMDEHKRELSPEAQRCLQQICESGVHMGHLIDDLLAFSRLGRQDLNKKLVRIDEIVQVAIEDLRGDREGRQVEFILGSLPACESDPALLRQVFVNLLSNALKFTRLREKARIEIGTLTAEDLRQLADTRPNGWPTDLNPNIPIFFVRDNGVGFDMRYADKLFGVFQRLHKKSQFEGTGVGLATVQRIIHRQGGQVWAEAKMNEGATFYFTLETPASCTSEPVCQLPEHLTEQEARYIS
jgi:PAS domain S-box-containing protein